MMLLMRSLERLANRMLTDSRTCSEHQRRSLPGFVSGQVNRSPHGIVSRLTAGFLECLGSALILVRILV